MTVITSLPNGPLAFFGDFALMLGACSVIVVCAVVMIYGASRLLLWLDWTTR